MCIVKSLHGVSCRYQLYELISRSSLLTFDKSTGRIYLYKNKCDYNVNIVEVCRKDYDNLNIG